MALSTAELGHCLNLNENPYGPPQSVCEALARAAAQANRYPEFLPHRLSRLIAHRLGCAPEALLVGAGATGVIMHILQETAAGVVLATPTFDGYPILTVMAGLRPITVPLTADGRQDLATMAAATGPDAGLIVICSPHNPTGTTVGGDALETLLRTIDPTVTVLLDEAYVEFVAPHERIDALALSARYPNLLVLRTFSKAYGLAALRIGYVVGDPARIARIARHQLPFGMNALAEVGVRASYDAEGEIAERIETIAAERFRLAAGLRQLGFEIPDSAANFVYLPVPEPIADSIRDALADAGIQVKHYPSGSRITVGDPAATAAVLSAVRSTVQ